MKDLITEADFIDFKDTPVVTGFLGKPVTREKDGPGPSDKAGDVMGWYFTDVATGEVSILGASAQVRKAVAQVKEGDAIRVEFMGQEKTVKGFNVNIFKIQLLEAADIAALKAESAEEETPAAPAKKGK